MASTALVSKRGIPEMEMIEDVETWLLKEKYSIEEGVRILEEKYKKYKYVESSMAAQKARMSEKLPELENSLALLAVMIDKKAKNETFETTYLISEEVYTKALVPKPDKVSIWLGANVMVEYELDDAKALLEKNRDSVQKVVEELTSELAFVKDQITTTEVDMAHVYNYGVKKRTQTTSS